MVINKDYHLPLYGKVIISGMQAVNSNSDNKWQSIVKHMNSIDQRYRQAIILHLDVNTDINNEKYLKFKRQMKMENWQFYEHTSCTWRVLTKRN